MRDCLIMSWCRLTCRRALAQAVAKTDGEARRACTFCCTCLDGTRRALRRASPGSPPSGSHPPWRSPRQLEIRDHCGEKPPGLAAGDGTMIEGERERQDAMHGGRAVDGDELRRGCGRRRRSPPSAARRPERHSARRSCRKFESVIVCPRSSSGGTLRARTSARMRLEACGDVVASRARRRRAARARTARRAYRPRCRDRSSSTGASGRCAGCRTRR